MKYQIDQSGKVEHTSKPTVVALANDNNLSVKITKAGGHPLGMTILSSDVQ